jgi:hypothetical protein
VKGFKSAGMTAIMAILLIGCTPAASPAPSQGLSPGPSQALSPGPSQALSPGTSPDLSAGSPGLVTGRLVWDANSGPEWQEDVEVEGGIRQRVRERTARSEMSDARLSGAVKVIDNADRFSAGPDSLLGDVLWGTVAIENDQGTWTGTLTGTSDRSAKGRGVSYIELVGAGAYEGLSAVLFERETAATLDWNGVIFSGDLPPDR